MFRAEKHFAVLNYITGNRIQCYSNVHMVKLVFSIYVYECACIFACLSLYLLAGLNENICHIDFRHCTILLLNSAPH